MSSFQITIQSRFQSIVRLKAVQKILVAAVVLMVLLLLPYRADSRAWAQTGQVRMPTGIDEALQPDFDHRDFKTIETDLKLNENQKTVVQAIFADYQAAFRQGADALRQQIGHIQPEVETVNPELERKREQIQARLAALHEETQKARSELPPDADLEEFRRQYLEKVNQLDEELRQLQPSSLPAEQLQKVMDQAAARIDSWQIEKKRLRDEFVLNLQTMLEEDQRTLWPKVERKLIREKTISSGRLSGEAVDLIQLVKELALAPAVMAGLESTLNDYELNLDAALRKRNELLPAMQDDLARAMQANDAKLSQSIVEKQTQLRVAVRDVNNQYAAIIADKLQAAGQEAAAKFNEAYRMRGFSRVFRTSAAQRLFAAAKQLPDLDPKVRQDVQELEKAFLIELVSMNETLHQVVKAHEPEEFNQRLRQRWSAGAGDGQAPESANGGVGGVSTGAAPGADPIQDAFRRKTELGQRFARQLESLLTPEQFAKLPKGGVVEGRSALPGARPPNAKQPNAAAGRLSLEERKKLVNQFDANGDGELDEQESAALREYLEGQPDDKGTE